MPESFDDEEQPTTEQLIERMIDERLPAFQQAQSNQSVLATDQRRRIADALERIAEVLEGWDRQGVPHSSPK